MESKPRVRPLYSGLQAGLETKLGYYKDLS